MIAVIDYGLGNLRSVSKALETVSADVEVTNDSKKIAQAEAIILPGVGAFNRGMENLKRLNILPSIFKAVEEGKPLLGICLGLQLLFTESQEHGIHKGLDVIRGKVKRFTGDVKVPHMGWNQIKFEIRNSKFEFFKGIPDESYFYFVHSYYVEPEDEDIVMATTEYDVEFASAVVKDNVLGVQFHPEKSAELGLKVLENFCRDVK